MPSDTGLSPEKVRESIGLMCGETRDARLCRKINTTVISRPTRTDKPRGQSKMWHRVHAKKNHRRRTSKAGVRCLRSPPDRRRAGRNGEVYISRVSSSEQTPMVASRQPLRYRRQSRSHPLYNVGVRSLFYVDV